MWRLDRLGRSLRHLIETVTALVDREIGFRLLTENIDTTTAGAEACSDIEFLASQRRLFGEVASDSTVYRTIRKITRRCWRIW